MLFVNINKYVAQYINKYVVCKYINKYVVCQYINKYVALSIHK